jgi:hypothetical protein
MLDTASVNIRAIATPTNRIAALETFFLIFKERKKRRPISAAAYVLKRVSELH